MRRTFATFYEGQDRDLMDILGQSDLKTTLVYRRSRDERKNAGVEALDYGLAEPSRTRRRGRRVEAVRRVDVTTARTILYAPTPRWRNWQTR